MKTAEEVSVVFGRIGRRLDALVEEGLISTEERRRVRLVTEQLKDGSHEPRVVSGTTNNLINSAVLEEWQKYQRGE